MKTVAALVLIASAIALPATAASPDPHAILADESKIVSDRGIDEARAVMIGGVRQWITVRGKDRRNPILLLIHGGPAAPELADAYLFQPAWTDYFTVVEWDQRGAGKTYELNDPAVVSPTMHRERFIEDAEELTAYLRATYGKKKIFVMGHSWGTSLGLELAHRRPNWLYAYIGAGQIISLCEGERDNYAWVTKTAHDQGAAEAEKELAAIAPYPAADCSITVQKIGTERKWSVKFGGLSYNRSSYDWWENAEKISPDYSEADFKAIDAGSAFTIPRLVGDAAAIDFTRLTRVDCPVIIFAGRHDHTTPSAPVQRWFERLRAPRKRWVWFDNSAHMMFGEEPGRVLVHLVQDARPIAAAAGDVAP